jgi:hypothetical protein
VSLTLHPAHRKALRLAVRKGGTLVSAPQLQPDGKRKLPKGTVSQLVALRLVDAGWATRYGDTLIATMAGKRRLGDPLPPKPPVYLASGGGAKYRTLPNGRQVEVTEGDDMSDHGYTTQRHRASDELETMDPSSVHTDWRLRAEAHRKLSRADLDAARLSGLDHPEERLRELRLMAAERGKDIRGDLRQLEHVVRRIERKVSEEAA